MLFRIAFLPSLLGIFAAVTMGASPALAGSSRGYAVTITLPEQPPSRVYCDLKEVNSQAEVQVEFDPATSARLSRTVTVGLGKWLLACSAEAKPQLVTPSKEAGSAPINVAWQLAAPPAGAQAASLDLKAPAPRGSPPITAHVTGSYGELSLGDETLARREGTFIIIASATPLPTLKQARASLSTKEGGKIGGRSLDATAPALVQDTLQILAEIAVERARTRGYALISQRITDLVCDEIKAPGPIPELGIAAGQRLLPNTCEAVRSMNLHEIAQSGPAISAAVERDLVAFALSATLQHLLRATAQGPVDHLLIQALLAVPGVDHLLRTGKLTPATVQGLAGVLLQNLSRWEPKPGNRSADLVSCGLQTALRAALACYADAACTDSTLASKVDPAIQASAVAGKPCVGVFQAQGAALAVEQRFATDVSQAVLEHMRNVSTVHSLPDLSLELLATVSHLTAIYAEDSANTSHAAVARHATFVIDSLALLLEPLLSGRTPTPREMQLIFIRLADHDWVSKPATPLECGLEIAFAAVAACHGSEAGCDARAVADFIAHPEQHFDLGDCEPLLDGLTMRGGLQEGWPQIAEFVAQGVDIVAPPAGSTPRDQARSTASMVFNLTFALGTPSMTPRTKQLLQHMKGLTLAIIEKDTRSSIVDGLAIARTALDSPSATPAQRKLLKTIERFTPILTTLTANARSLKEAAANPDQAEALRKARKESIQALIDASTDRSNRGGEWVVSFGTGVGFYTGWKASGDGATRMTSLALPTGIAVQELPSSAKQDAWDTFPQLLVPDHFQATFVDLGQFISQEQKDVRWNDFLLIGGQVGWIPNFFQSPSDSVVLGADIRYIPGGSRRGEMFIGGFAAYYVPFFDLN